MKLLNLRAKGFIGFKKGLNLDEVSIDLSGLAGLVALDGPNGRGKTTRLELLSPYRTFASRKKALQHHAKGLEMSCLPQRTTFAIFFSLTSFLSLFFHGI